MNAGAVAFRLGLRGMTIEAEAGLVARDLRCCGRLSGTRSAAAPACAARVDGAALEAIRDAKAEGLQVTCEAAPHHFALTEEAVGTSTRTRR